MRLIKPVIIISIIISMVSCSQASTFQLDTIKTSIKTLNYKIYKDNEEIGYLTYSFKDIENDLQIIVEKGFNANFLVGLDKNVKKIKLYTIDKNFSLLDYNEEEYVDNEIYYKINQSVTGNKNFKNVTIKVDEKECLWQTKNVACGI